MQNVPEQQRTMVEGDYFSVKTLPTSTADFSWQGWLPVPATIFGCLKHDK